MEWCVRRLVSALRQKEKGRTDKKKCEKSEQGHRRF